MGNTKSRSGNGDTRSFDKIPTRRFTQAERDMRLFVRTFVYALFVLTASVMMAIWAISVANDALALVKAESEVEVVIEKGSSGHDLAQTLKQAGIIKYETFFRLFARITKADSKFKYGKYVLNTGMGYLELTNALKKHSAFRETAKVMIPEGRELREIVKTLVDNKVCEEKDLWEVFNNYEFEYDFLAGVPKRENWLEGYLFPDTYEFYIDHDPVDVVKKFLNNFDKKYSKELRERTAELGMTIDEVVTLASIIEREAASDEDRTTVASVFVNRLESDDYPFLQSCATVQYVLKERKAVLSIADTQINSPYNTYMYKGLPVGPIASPGLASIKAALYPEETDYYFFVVNSEGAHTFSKTYSEHLKAIRTSNSSRGTATVE